MPRMLRSEYSVAAVTLYEWVAGLLLCARERYHFSSGTATPPQPAAPVVRLVSAEEGREIAAAALEQDGPISGRQDCSHLVHQIYADAGTSILCEFL